MQIGLTVFMAALAASWSEEKSRGTDDATVRASPSRVGRRWLTTSNSRQSKLVLDVCGSATGHATPMVTRELTERFDMSLPCLEVRRSARARATVTMRILLVSAISLASLPREFWTKRTAQNITDNDSTQRHGKGSWTVSWIKSAITPALKEKRLVHLTGGRPGGCGE